MAQEFNIVGNLLLKVDGAEAGLNKLKNSLSKLEMPKGLENSFKKSFSNLDDIFARYRKQLEKGFDSKTDVSNITKIGKELDSELTKISNHFTKLTGEKIDFKIDTAPVQQAKKDLEEVLEKRRQLVQEKLEFKIESPKEGIDNIKQLLQEFQRVTGDTKAGRAAGNALFQLETGDIEKAISFLREAENNLNRIGDKKKETFSSTGFTFGGALETIIKELNTTEGELGVVNDKAKLFKDILAQAQTGQLKDVDTLLEKIGQSLTKNAGSAREAAKAVQDYAQSTVSMKDQVKQLQQSTQYFFGLRNMLNLFKRGIKEAVDTVKQLDAAMTETAVVTDFSVGDMWAKLPEYTANANALGATVQDMYESTTLYYQQGLDTQQAMGIATETMKMARIAGLEAKDATDMMTAALRGFNMELDNTSATRINDVYSNLAAKTASDTKEIGKAMQRTASIAHSAGMSFEGTAAFLAQAIETTREPAENIGTAMKTIVARFQEMKKNPLEISDVEGEEVSFNKVDDALKTIGVDLKDTNGQFRDLDEVFLDISQKWDGLSQTQQRYIATVAAGSRQQSRFIAMMSDYERTMELMGYANNSAGASTTQFNKTLDSLEAKINKFQNAWKQFLMGIMNDSWTKKVVDAGTSVLNIVNKIIDALSFGGKLKGVKSILSTFTAFTALRSLGRGANSLIGGLGGMLDPKSSFKAGAQTGAIGKNSAQAVSQPIVKELQSIRALIAQRINQSNLGKSTTTNPYDEYYKFRDARKEIASLNGRGSIEDLTKQLSGLSKNNQNLLMGSNTGTFYAATNAILKKYYSAAGAKEAVGLRRGERFLNDQRKSGEISALQYFKALQDPGLLKKAMTQAGVDKDNAAFKYIESLDKIVSDNTAELQTRAAEKANNALTEALPQILEKNPDFDVDAARKKIQNAFYTSQAEEYYRNQALQGEGKTSFSTGKVGLALDKIGQLGSGLSQAGMGLQAFGGILTSSANPAIQTFGTALTSVGGLISGLGMGIAGITQGFTAIAGSSIMTAAESALAGTALGGLGLTAGMLTGILGVLVAAIAGAAFLIKKHRDNIKKDAEEVTTKYKDKSSENQSNIANLKQWKSELAVLSKGVDENGYNINLDTADYDHYLEIVDAIATINPEIVQGYNAQGHAIIDNNKALKQTLALEQQREKDLLKDYTSPESLTKLLKARNLERRRYGNSQGIETVEYELKPRTNMRGEMRKIGQELQKNKDLIDLSKLNIDIDQLAGGSEAEFQKVLNNYNVFKQLVSDSIDRAGDEWSDKSKEAIEKSISSFEEYGSELDELVQPVYEALSASASQTAGFQEMADNLKAPFQNALKELATNGEFEDGREIDKAAKNMATKFAGYSEIYLDAMDKVEEANKQFALDFNEQEYDTKTEDAIKELEDLKATLEDTPEGHAISEWIDSEIYKIENHLSTGIKSIEEAWDTISDKVAVAESALDDFNNKTEKDFYTAADNMQQIYEKVMDPDAYHTIGLGDNTFWAGAESLLGTNNIMNKTKGEVLSMMKSIEPFLKEGPEGVKNFADRVAELAPKLEKIEGVHMEDGWFASIEDNVNPEVWAQIADYMGISEELLTSMVNKSRQFKQWDFSDMTAIREAYAIDESIIHGKKKTNITTTTSTGEETTVKADTLYITDAELRSRMGSDYYQKSERESKIEQLRNKGIEVLPEHLKDLTAQMMKNEMGIADWNSAIKTFGDTGVFDKSEIYEAAKILAKEEQGKDFNEDTFREQFNEGWTSWLESYEDPTIEPINSMAADVAAIAGKVVGESSADKKDNKKEDKQSDNTKTEETAEKIANGVLKAEEKDSKNTSNQSFLNTPIFETIKNLFGNISQNAKEQAEAAENYKNIQGKTAEDLQQSNKEWWSKTWDWFIGKNTDTTSSSQTDINTNTTSDSLNETFNQLATTIEPLSSAGEGLNTAATNLNAAAVLLGQGAQGNKTNGQGQTTQGPSAPSTTVNNANASIIIDAATAQQTLNDLNTLVDTVKANINEGATFNIETSSSGLEDAAKKAKTITDASGSKNISVTASGADNTNTLTDAVSKFSALKDHEVKLKTTLSGATVTGINNMIKAIDEFHTKKSHTVTLTTIKKDAAGAHNHGYISSPSFGSAASGYGQVGPKGKGGLTLTGELGYEVAWIPSENRSMILGANGPQLVNLPGDAVVWTHEQSKKIVKQKAIPAGSQVSGTSSGGWDFSGWSGNSGNNSKNSTSKAITKTTNHVRKKVTEATDTITRVSVWWENIARKTELSQRIQDNNQKAFEKYLKEMQATLRKTGESLESGGGGGDDYIKSISKTLGYYENQLEKVNTELAQLVSGEWQTGSNKGQSATSKKTKKKKENQVAYEQGAENIAKISYKSGKKTKDEYINLADYIKEEDGTYIIDQKALSAISSAEKQEAVKNAADKEINDRLTKRYKAEDGIEKAQEAIEKIGEELYETFFKWETELTKIWNITQKIEQTEARISQAKGYSELLESQLSTGMAKAGINFANQTLSAFKTGIQQQATQINQSFEALSQKKIDLSKLISLDDEKETLANVQQKLVASIYEQDNIAKLEEQLANKQEALNQATSKRETLETREQTIDADIASTKKKTKSKKKKTKAAAKKKLTALEAEKTSLPTELANVRTIEASAVEDYEAAKTAYEEAKKELTLNDTQYAGYEEYAKAIEDSIATQTKAWKFMTAQQLADGTINVTFDSEVFDAEKLAGNITEEQGKAIQDYVKSITDSSKELSQQYTDTISLINDMYGELNNLQDAWAGYADQLWQISDEQQKKEVDNLKKLSDSLNNTLKNLLDDVKRKLDDRRKQEDNTKTERDISQKQQRLAALRADTAGGHQVEIAQLQQEIANDQQTYQRSLEDQLLDKLQQQADLAAQQRERQIALQEATISEINNAAQVNAWMNEPEKYRNEIYEAFKEANDYNKKPEALQQQLDNEFNTLFNGLLTNQEEQQLVTDQIRILEGKTDEIKSSLDNIVNLGGILNDLVGVISQLDIKGPAPEVTKPTGITESQTTAAVTSAAQTAVQQAASAASTPTDNTAVDAYKAAIDAAHNKKTVSKDTFIDAVNKGKAAGIDVAQVARDLAEGDGKGGVTWEETVKAAKKANYTKAEIAKWSTDPYLAKAIKKWSKFAKGGLADYTGPAWLDGTPSKPELVLNPTDTKNFLALRDILSSAMKATSSVTNSYGGDATYEININVDRLTSDYDVDKVAERVKKIIVKDSGYRNVTQVRNFR